MLSWWMTVVWAHAGDGTVFEAAADGALVLAPDNGVLADLGTAVWIDPSDPEVGELAARGVFLDPWGGLIFRPRETTPSAFSAVLKVHSFADETKSRTLAFRKLPPANLPPITPTIGLVASEETVVSLAGLDEGTVAPKLYVDDPRVTVTCDQWTCTVKATPAKGDETPFFVEYRLRDADHAVGIGRLIVATERGAPPTVAQPVLTTTGTDGSTIAFGGEEGDWVEVLDAPAHGRLLRKSSTSFTYQPDPVTVGADADSFEFVRHGAWGKSPQGVVPLPAHTEGPKDRDWSVPFHADPDGSMTLDLRAPGIAGWPVPDGRATVKCPDGCSATVVNHEARITLDAKQLAELAVPTLSLTLTYGGTERRLHLDVSDVQADQGWCSAELVPTNPERQTTGRSVPLCRSSCARRPQVTRTGSWFATC